MLCISGIFFVVDLVKGKEHPCQVDLLDFEELLVNTVGLLLRMMKIHFETGMYVILDSDLCLL